jgi:cytidylate kinase
MIIAIDGPAASGKSTAAVGVAKRLGITYLDTGAMYRAVTFGLIDNQIGFKNSLEIENFLEKIEIKFSENQIGTFITLNGRDITNVIRSEAVTKNVSEVSALNSVRKSMVLIQRKMAEVDDCILEGRDIGTVVFPNADFKFFLTADKKSRAERRLNDLKAIGEKSSVEKVMYDLISRDHKDSTRSHSPLKKSDDAIIIDTSELGINKVIDKIVNIVKHKGH